MKRREFFKASGGLASLISCGAIAFETADGAEQASLFSSATANAALSESCAKIKVFGLGGFGCRMVSRFAYDVDALFEGNLAKPAFFALDTDKDSLASVDVPLVLPVLCKSSDSVLQSAGAMPPSSLVILMAGIGGATGKTLMLELAQQMRRSGAFVVALVTKPRDDPQQDAMVANALMRLEQVSDVVFVLDQPEYPLSKGRAASVVARAKSLFEAERRMLQCAAGLLQAVALPSRTTLGVDELRAIFADTRKAGFGVAGGRYGQEIGRCGAEAFTQALTCNGMEPYENLRAALVVFSGPAAQLRWASIQAGKDEMCRLLGADVRCLFGVQANENIGHSQVKAKIWLAFS
jgi:cell division GTPase FtsZ